MAVQTMTGRSGDYPGYHHAEDIADGVTAEPVRIPPMHNAGSVSCSVISSGNTGKMQYSTSSDALVAAGSANWTDWTAGNVTATTRELFTGPLTAVRGVSVSGAISIEVVL